MRKIIVFTFGAVLFLSGCLMAERYGIAGSTKEQRMAYEVICLEEISKKDFQEKMDTNPAYVRWITQKCPDFIKE